MSTAFAAITSRTAAAKQHIARWAAPVTVPLAAAVKRTRGGRVAIALGKWGWGQVPKWLRRTLGFCVIVPGPFDELAGLAAVLVFVTVPLVVSGKARRELAQAVGVAWNGTVAS